MTMPEIYVDVAFGVPPGTTAPQASATFTRSSVAYKLDGSQVAANVPRFEALGSTTGLLVEEGALYLSFNIVSGVDGYIYVDMTSAPDYTVQAGDYLEYDVFWFASIPTVRYIAIDYTCSNGTNLRDSGAVDQNGLTAHPRTDISAHASGKWYHRKIAIPSLHVGQTITFFDLVCELDAGAVAGMVRNIVITDGAGTIRNRIWGSNYGLPGLAVHLNSDAGNTYSFTEIKPDILSIPTTGVLNLQEGTIECWVYITGPLVSGVNLPGHSRSLFAHVYPSWPRNGLNVQKMANTTSVWRVQSTDDAGAWSYVDITPNIAEGWHYFAYRWSAAELALSVDGATAASIVNPKLPSQAATTLHIADSVDSSETLNSYIRDLRISNVARSDAEIAAAYAAGRAVYDAATSYMLRLAGDISYRGGEWRNVAAFMRQLAVRHGRQHELDRYEAGTCTFVLDNHDRRFDPTYTAGPYYPNVLPMRRVRVEVTWADVSYTIFTGFIEKWPLAWPHGRDAIVTVEAVDGFKFLHLKKLNANFASQLSSTRVAAVLDSVGWPTADRDISTGKTTLQASTLANVSALQHLLDVQSAENGRLFCNGQGKVVFHDRYRPLRAPYNASMATFGDGAGELPYTDTKIAYDDSTIWNEVIVQRDGGAPQTAIDNTSQASYFTRTLSRTGTLHINDNECYDAAQYLLSKYKEPELRILSISIVPRRDPDVLWPQVLAREIGDRVTVIRRPITGGAAITRDYIIEAIQHDSMPGFWTTKWQLSPAETEEYWVLGDSLLGVLGSSTRLGY